MGITHEPGDEGKAPNACSASSCNAGMCGLLAHPTQYLEAILGYSNDGIVPVLCRIIWVTKDVSFQSQPMRFALAANLLHPGNLFIWQGFSLSPAPTAKCCPRPAVRPCTFRRFFRSLPWSRTSRHELAPPAPQKKFGIRSRQGVEKELLFRQIPARQGQGSLAQTVETACQSLHDGSPVICTSIGR